MLEDYRLHQVLTRRYYASKNPIKLEGCLLEIHEKYILSLSESDLSKSTIGHYDSISKVFMDYLSQKGVGCIESISLNTCNGYLKTLAGYSFKTVEQNVCALRHFLRFLKDTGLISSDIADGIHKPAISKKAKIPSAWTAQELRALIASIDRNSPIGKRDYAMILLACVLGLRVSDIKNLRFSNFDWEQKQLSFVQHKTHKPLSLPIPDVVGGQS